MALNADRGILWEGKSMPLKNLYPSKGVSEKICEPPDALSAELSADSLLYSRGVRVCGEKLQKV